MRHLRSSRGFTLLEVLVAITILAMGLLGTSAMITLSIRGSEYSKRLTEATNLAQKKIEEVRNYSFNALQDDCNSPGKWTGGDMTLCTAQPADMPLEPTQAFMTSANDSGNDGDEVSGDGMWTYRHVPSPPDVTDYNGLELTWGVQRNYPAFRLIRVFARVTWKGAGGKDHDISVETIKANVNF